MRRLVERAWAHDGLAGLALAPLSWAFGAAVALRNAAYDHGLLRSHALGLPAVSVGNLSVGGTGKTPIAAWVAQWFLARGVTPAILLRGYGDDEPLVHARLTPGAIVVPDRDRLEAATRAKAQGARVLVLDDAFQHRRARRDADLVLISAEQGGARRLLPAGPLREGRRALRRAHAIIVTRKSASVEQAEAVGRAWAARTGMPALPVAIAHLAASSLRGGGQGGQDRPISGVARARVLAISAIGNPAAFEDQLRAAGASVVPARFPDHHAFTTRDMDALARKAADVDLVVCTLKDAVKLEPRWPAFAPPFWYLSQAVTWERGERVLTDLLGRLAATDTDR